MWHTSAAASEPEYNINEAAVYGIPVVFGPTTADSRSRDLIGAGGGFSVGSAEEFSDLMEGRLADKEARREAAAGPTLHPVQARGDRPRLPFHLHFRRLTCLMASDVLRNITRAKFRTHSYKLSDLSIFRDMQKNQKINLLRRHRGTGVPHRLRCPDSQHSSRNHEINEAEARADSLRLVNDRLQLSNEFNQLNAEFSQYEDQQVYLKNDSLVKQYNQARMKVEGLLKELNAESAAIPRTAPGSSSSRGDCDP